MGVYLSAGFLGGLIAGAVLCFLLIQKKVVLVGKR